MVYIEVHDPFGTDVDTVRLARAASLALQDLPATSERDLTIVITDNEQIRNLNQEYLGIDAPTDVLSFPAGHTDPGSGTEYLGDIIVSFPRARQQAEAAGHPVMDELQLLVVHGVLHLLGHDHAGDAEKAQMWAAQREILDHLGLSAINPPAE